MQSPGVRAGLGGGPGRPSLRGVMGFEKWRRLDSENFPTCRRAAVAPVRRLAFRSKAPRSEASVDELSSAVVSLSLIG